MAALNTITEISVSEAIVCKVDSGTGRRRAEVFIRGVAAATSDTLDLATYIRGVQGIEMPLAETNDEAVRTTSSTWSGTTITFAGMTGSGRYQGTWIVYF